MRRSIGTIFLQFSVLCGGLLLPAAAHAQSSSVAEVLCTIGGWLWGPLGSIIGVLGIIAIGITAMFGRIQIGTVLTTMAGIALIFGAQSVVNALGLNASCSSSTSAVDIISSPIYHMFACMVGWFNGAVGKSLATLAIIVLGVFAIYGRISYHQALVVATGIATMFGAVSIVSNLGMTVSGGGGGGGTGNFPLQMACATSSSIETVYCSVVSWFNGPLGKGVGTMGIIIVGLGALYGKTSWGIAIIAGLGAAMIFGGTSIVSALGGPGDMDCAASSASGQLLSFSIMFCNVVNWFNGPIGKGVATLAIIVVGLGSLFGKVSWTMSIVVGVGVALIFGGTTVLSALGGSGDMPCTPGYFDGNAAVVNSSTSSSGGGGPSSSGGGQPGGSTYNFGSGANAGSISYPDTSNPGTITLDALGSAMIPAGTLPGQTVTLGNGWVLNMPGPGQWGSVTIPGPPIQTIDIDPLPSGGNPGGGG